MGLFYVNNSFRTCLNQNKTFITYKNQLREKYFVGKINTNLKLSCAFVNERTQHILHPCQSLFILNVLI